MIVECTDCDAKVDAELKGAYEVLNTEDAIVWKYRLLKCPQCFRPMVSVEERSAMDSDNEWNWSEPRRVYPPLDTFADSYLPEPIADAYEEARLCFKAKAYSASAIMCRKSLEGMCREHGVRRRNLASGLKQLRDKGIIEDRLFQWAEALRIAGNEAAHDAGANLSRQDAKDILEFTAALLQYVFTFSDRFDRFMERRADTRNSGSGT